MSEFLKNLKSGKDNPPQKKKYPYDSHQYHYQKQYKGNEKRTGMERRNSRDQNAQSQEALTKLLSELAPVLKQTLVAIIDNQERLIIAQEARAKAEENKAETIINLVEYLKSDGFDALMSVRENTKKKKKAKKPIDANRKKVMQIIAKMRAKGDTFEEIALKLDKEKLPTFSGRGQWHAQTIHRLYQDHIMGE